MLFNESYGQPTKQFFSHLRFSLFHFGDFLYYSNRVSNMALHQLFVFTFVCAEKKSHFNICYFCFH